MSPRAGLVLGMPDLGLGSNMHVLFPHDSLLEDPSPVHCSACCFQGGSIRLNV